MAIVATRKDNGQVGKVFARTDIDDPAEGDMVILWVTLADGAQASWDIRDVTVAEGE